MKQMLWTWGYVLTHPYQSTLETELRKPNVNQKTAISWLFAGTLLAAVIGGISAFLQETIFPSYVGARQMQVMVLLGLSSDSEPLLEFFGSPVFGGIKNFFSVLIFVPIILLTGNAAVFWLAKRLGGKGTYDQQVFALALIAPALLLVLAILGFQRNVIVFCVTPAVWLIGLVLAVQAVRSIHGLTTVRAVITTLVPFAVLTIIAWLGMILISPLTIRM